MSSPVIDAFMSASAMLESLRQRRVSALELLDLHLRRIERYNPALNAIVTPNDTEVRRAAAAADAARAGGEERALLGLPLTIKDCIDVAGLRGTAGLPPFAERRPPADAPVAARVRAAGGVLIGKTNVPPRAADWQANNPIFGRTVNPWDSERTPGGSTGGGAAAVAAGLTPLEFGSDIGGSIRVPAAFCGIYGHRPSETAVPRSGHFPSAPLPNAATVMGVQGPLARSAEDLELALDVIAGPEAGEDAAWRLQIPPARHERLAEFRVAVLPPIPWLPLDDEIAAAVDRLATNLAQLGARGKLAQPEPFGDLRDHHALYLRLLMVMMNLGMTDAQRRQAAERLRTHSTNPFAPAMAEGVDGTAAQYLGWHGQREDYRAAYRAFFRDWDILLAPAYGVPAFKHFSLDEDFNDRVLEVNGRPVPYPLQLAYPAVATLSGQPATAFPVGLTRGGLPIGLQAIGPYLEDRTPIRFTALVAREFGGFRPPPGYNA